VLIARYTFTVALDETGIAEEHSRLKRSDEKGA
jgi:hypothetical protein